MEIEIRYVRQTSEPGRYAWIWLNAKPADEDQMINQAGLEPHFFDGLVVGLRSVLGNKKFDIRLTRAKTHPIDSNAFSFQRAGAQAAEAILKQYAVPNRSED